MLLRLVVAAADDRSAATALQVLFERQRRAEEEAREFALREDQLHSAGRLAAEIAHQIKNPLGIINNAAFSLQRAIGDKGKIAAAQQIQIIREEVERPIGSSPSDGLRAIGEGQVEKLELTEELDRAIARSVFRRGAGTESQSSKANYAAALPPLFMQRGHLSEIVRQHAAKRARSDEGNGRIMFPRETADSRLIGRCLRFATTARAFRRKD